MVLLGSSLLLYPFDSSSGAQHAACRDVLLLGRPESEVDVSVCGVEADEES